MKIFRVFTLSVGLHLPAVIALPGEWSSAGSMPVARSEHGAVLLTGELAEGRVLVLGGVAGETTALYDPTANAWTAGAALPMPMAFPFVTSLANDLVLVMGYSPDVYRSTTPLADQWEKVSGNGPQRRDMTSTPLADGTVLVAGGRDDANNAFASAQVFNPVAKVWVAVGSMKVPRKYHTATRLLDGRVLVVGGLNGNSAATATTEIYNPATKAWTLTQGSLATARARHRAALLADGRVLVMGGVDFGNSSLASAEIYDPATDAWTATGGMTVARGRKHTATVLASGQVLVTGGSGEEIVLPNAELYDPASGMWTATGSMQTARSWHTATLLPDGRVLVAGGIDGSNEPSSSAEIYEPAPVDTPTPTPTVTSAIEKPVVAISGRRKLVTTKASVRVKGKATGAVTKVTLKNGKKTVKVTGTMKWSAKVKLHKGWNKLTATATAPGGPGNPVLTSGPAKVTIVRK